MTAALLILAAALAAAALLSVRVLREYERAVVFRLGRLLPIKGPGPVLLWPGVDRMVRVDLRTITMTIPPQELITRDNVPARVAAVCYFAVVDPRAAVTAIEAFAPATSQVAQTTLRSVLGSADLDQLLAERERLNEQLQRIIDEQTEPWGVKVSAVEIKDVEIPEAMQRAMARQAEAERERRAKIINAEGEHQAAEKLVERRRDPRPRALRAAAALPADAARDRRPSRTPRSSSRSRSTCSRRSCPAGPRPTARVRASDVDEWTVIRFLHVVAVTFFVGGQLVLAVAVVPALRGRERRRRRCGRSPGASASPSAVALAVAIATGVAMAGHLGRWDDPTLQAKLGLLVLIGVLLALHVATPYTRAISLTVLATSILIVWLGLRLTHG